MTKQHLTQSETAKRLASFRPKRAIGTMALTSLFALASLFMAGCEIRKPEKKITAEALPQTAKIIPQFRVIEGITKSEIYVGTEETGSGTRRLVMTEKAYDRLHTSQPTVEELHEGQETFRQLDKACAELTDLPFARIATEPNGYVWNAEIIQHAFERVYAARIRAKLAAKIHNKKTSLKASSTFTPPPPR